MASSKSSVSCIGDISVEYNVRNGYDPKNDFLANTTYQAMIDSVSTEEATMSYAYDDLGRLISVNRPIDGNKGTVSYKYNIQGWLTDIESCSFKEHIYYNEGLGSPLYAGNISSISWNNRVCDRNMGYRFIYDSLNRLTDSEYGEDDFSKSLGNYDERLSYDWNGNGYINQVIFVCASFSGNTSSPYFNTNGFLWPSTSSISTITTPDGLKISNYSACAELWPTKTPRSCGFSTICHEFSHSLGLPDIYPTNSSAGYSVCDEWDLMDGGNFTNYGWCPVNYTALEKMLMGWLTPVELTEDSLTIEGLKPVEEGGNAYIIKHSDDEWLMLENRQQRGWDAGAPGKGLVIYHVNYSASVWKNNKVNNDATKRRFELVHADNMDYDAWDDYLTQAGLGFYEHSQKMNRRLLSTSPYPWIDDSTGGVLNDSLTDTSVPAAVMFYPGLTGNPLFNKPITNIKMTDEGLISFDFMGGAPVVVDGITTHPFTLHSSPFTCHQIYDLNGRRLAAEPQKGVYVIRKQDGTIRKIFK